MCERCAADRKTAPLRSAGPPPPSSADTHTDATPPATDAAPPERTTPRPDLFDLLFGDDTLPEPPLPDLPLAGPARPDLGALFVSPPLGPDPFAPAGPAVAADGAARAPRAAVAAPGGGFEHHRSLSAGERGPGPDDETRRISRASDAAARPQTLVPRLARRRVFLATAALAAVAAVPVQLVAAGRGDAAEPAFARELAAADDRLAAGRIATPAGDAALDHLEAARGLLPEDVRLTSRGKALAGTLEALGEHALGRGDLQEARAHFRGALRADPLRSSARAKLETIDRITPLPPDGRR